MMLNFRQIRLHIKDRPYRPPSHTLPSTLMNKRVIFQFLLPVMKKYIAEPRISNSFTGGRQRNHHTLIIPAEAHSHLADLHADGDAFNIAGCLNDAIFFLREELQRLFGALLTKLKFLLSRALTVACTLVTGNLR